MLIRITDKHIQQALRKKETNPDNYMMHDPLCIAIQDLFDSDIETCNSASELFVYYSDYVITYSMEYELTDRMIAHDLELAIFPPGSYNIELSNVEYFHENIEEEEEEALHFE